MELQDQVIERAREGLERGTELKTRVVERGSDLARAGDRGR
jgi:hypothetical protein